MTAGIPVIATPVGGIPDFLTEEETGIFCEPNNPESIVRAIMRLEDTELRNRIISNAQAIVHSTYSWDLVAKAMCDILKP
jgi:glycosyltransferase involved in cell wall biosynthesis